NYYPTTGGRTTIFIGGDTNTPAIQDAITGKYFKNNYSFTPNAYSDYPHTSLSDGINHVLHSNPFNLAYVDPTATVNSAGIRVEYSTAAQTQVPANWATTESDDQIAQDIAHEAGHTYGLVHVRTDGLTDPALPDPTNTNNLGVGKVGDLMSYNTAPKSVALTHYVNQSLPVTDFNYNPGNANLSPPKPLTAQDPSFLPYS